MSPQIEAGAYWEERLREHEGLGGVGWLGLGESFNRWMYAVRARVFARAVRAAAGAGLPAMHAFDAGSGTGFYIDRWRRLGVESVTGSDLTEVAVERLRSANPGVEVVRFDLTAAEPPASGPYDAVSAMDVLFHILDEDGYRRALANLSSLLRPGGLLFFSENFVSGSRIAGGHQVTRTEDEILAACAAAGLEPVGRLGMFVLMNTPVVSGGRALRRWWAGLTKVVGVHDSVGRVAGALLYPVELLLLRVVRPAPSTELMVCRKR